MADRYPNLAFVLLCQNNCMAPVYYTIATQFHFVRVSNKLVYRTARQGADRPSFWFQRCSRSLSACSQSTRRNINYLVGS